MNSQPETDARRQRYAIPLYAIMRQNGWDGERTEQVVHEMDLVLDAVLTVADAELAERRAANLHEAANAIEAEQHRLDDEENERLGGLSESAAAEHVAIHRAAGTLRRMADNPQPTAVSAAVAPPTQAADDLPPAATCSAQYHGAYQARLCIRAAQHQRTAHTDEHGFHWSDTVAVYPVADGTFRTGTDVRDELRRMADETATAETHACPNCEGVDPDTCINNPHRPPEQCPRSEGDGYGLQCQKPAGHNLCTFEEQPAAGARQDGATQ